MMQIRRVLAATDLSAPARHAAARALQLAREHGAQLTIMHVAARAALEALRAMVGARPAPVEEKVLNELRAELELLAATLARGAGEAPEVHLATGSVPDEVAACANALDAGLIVLGARGASFMRHLVLGSTAERMLRKAARPILVVKQTPFEAYHRVLVPVDFSPWSLPVLRLARAVAPRAELVLLHAYEVPFEGKLRFAGVDDRIVEQYRQAARDEATRHLTRLAADGGLERASARLNTCYGAAARCIIQQEEEQDCDLIVLGKHGRGLVEELLLGSVTKRVLAESSADVLVCAEPGR